MKIDSIDKVTSFDSPISDPLGNDDKTIMGIYKSPSKSKVDIPVVRKSAGLSDLNYTPYKPVNITGQAKKAYDYYLNRGVKPNVAAGIVGNLYKESGLNPTAVGDKGTAFGVAQWRGDRLSNLKKYASSKGKSHTDLTTQLDFILDEKGENQVLSLMGSQSPEVAAKTFADKYERPNPQYADYSTRSSVAKQLGKMKYGGKIQLYPDGGKVKPIITNNPKDPRLVAYQDSLNLYNLSTAQYKKAKNPSKITGTSEDFTDIVNDSKVVKGNVRQFVQGDLDNNKEDNVYNNDEFVHSKIKPVGEYWWSNKGNYNPLRMTEGNKNFLYKKPNQPVVYQPKTEPKEQVIQKGSLMDSKSRVVKTPKGRVAYSIPKYPVLQDNKPVVSQELPIDSVALPNEDKYVAPVVKQKEYTRGQQSYELNSDYVKRLHTENVTGKKMKPKLIRNAFGGFIPKYALGAGELMGLVSQGLNLGAGFIDSTNDPENPNVAKSGISGFIKGNAALPGIGGILGGISSIRDAKKQRELFQKKKDIESRGVMDYFNIRSKGILGDYNTQGEQGSFYAKGGIPNPQYEVEHGEVIVGDDVKLTGGKQIASNLHKVVGKTHDQFNPNTVNGTGEDGQGGQFIFSNRLQLGGKTFAKLAEGVAKQKAKAEEMMAHNDYIFKNTGQANAEIADAKLQQLAQIQEMMKGEINPVGQFKFGGKVSKYPDGKNLTEDKGVVEGRNFLTNWYKKRNLVTKPIDVSKSLDYVKDDLPGFVKADGLYNPINNKAHFNETKPITASLATHEFTHAIDDKYGDNINFKDSLYENNKKVLKTDYTSLGVKPIEGSLNTYGNLTYDYVTKPEETYARLNELRQSSGHEPNKVVTTDDIKKLKRNNDLFMFYSDEDIMKMWNELSSKNRKSSFPNQLSTGLVKAKFGGSIPKFGVGGSADKLKYFEEQGLKIARQIGIEKDPVKLQKLQELQRDFNFNMQKERNALSKVANKVENTVVKNVGKNIGNQAANTVGKNLPVKIASQSVGKVGATFAGTAARIGVGAANVLTKVLNHPATWLATGLSGDVSTSQKRSLAKVSKYSDANMSPELKAKLESQGFTTAKLNNNKTNPNELTIPERRALRNSIPTATPSAPTTPTIPQGTKKPSGNKINLNIDKPNPIVDNPIRNQFNNLNPLSNKQINNSVKLLDLSNRVDASKVVPPIRKVDNTTASNENFSPVIGAALSGINYFANQNMINKYKTQTPATLLQNPNYQYFDRSGGARNSVRGITNTIMNNPFINQGTKQAALANSMNVMNDVNQQELNRKQEYDRSYRGQQLDTENRNTMILNQARQQTMQNENQKQGLRQDNLNNLFSNVNTNLAEFQANKQQDKAMQYMSLPYFKRLNLTDGEIEEFKKNPSNFLMGKNSSLPQNKKGGRIKMKYC